MLPEHGHPPQSYFHIHITTSRYSQIVQARNLASRRGARYLSAEDLIFLIRHDRAKVNRLRTYLSWKDVRRHAKDSGGDGTAMEVETLEDGADGEPFCDGRWGLRCLVLTEWAP